MSVGATLRITVAATSLVASIDRVRLIGIAGGLLGLDVGKVDDAFLGADDHGADPADRLAPAGLHVAEDNGATRRRS